MIVDPDFADHWKTRMLVGHLEGDEAAPVYVLRLWAHCQNRRQDTFDNLTAAALKALCRYPGDAKILDSGLTAAGFVRREAGVLIVCNWSEYNASLIAAWNNGSRGGRPPKSNAKNPQANQQETHGFTRREEEIREEKNKTEKEESAAADVAPATLIQTDTSGIGCPYTAIGNAFDATFGGRSQLTDKRRKAMRARWRDQWWRDNWQEALARAGPSTFLRGGNDRGWVIDLEFFVRPDTVAKILEGKYDNRATGHRNGNTASAREQRNADSFAIVLEAAAETRAALGISIAADNRSSTAAALRHEKPS